ALAAAVTDARAFIIPDELNLAMAALGFAAAAVDAPYAPGAAMAEAAARGAALGLAFLGLRALYRLWRGREGLGLGDVKLAAVAGVWLGWTIVPLAVELAALAALLACAALHVSGRRLDRLTRLPFGLFFAPAIWLGWLAQSGAFGVWSPS
uniref:prepilin peptidase n=1 Tax=Methylocella sp. TaxID=1978226 RepID=UPI003784D5C5